MSRTTGARAELARETLRRTGEFVTLPGARPWQPVIVDSRSYTVVPRDAATALLVAGEVTSEPVVLADSGATLYMPTRHLR